MPEYRYMRFDGFVYRQLTQEDARETNVPEVWRSDARRWEAPSIASIGLEALWYGMPLTEEQVRAMDPDAA